MTACIYARASTLDQQITLENQVKKCKLQAEMLDLEVVDTIVDSGCTAKNLDREGMQKLLKMVRNKEVKTVLIFKLDRISRDVSQINFLIQTFNKYGVNLVSVKDNLDTDSAMGRMVVNIMGCVAQGEREQIAERCKEASNHLRDELKPYTRDVFGFDRQGDSLIENRDESQIIDYIISERDSGVPFYKIANFLTEQGIPTKRGKAVWHWSSVRNIYNRVSKMAA